MATPVRTSERPPNHRIFGFCRYSCYVLIKLMTDRPASGRVPTPKQMEKLAAGRRDASEYWQAVMDDLLAEAKPKSVGSLARALRLSEISQHILRVSCRRCARTVEIQKADAVRLYRLEAVWKDVGLIEHLGDQSHLYLDLGGQPVVTLADPEAKLSAGDIVSLINLSVRSITFASEIEPTLFDHATRLSRPAFSKPSTS